MNLASPLDPEAQARFDQLLAQANDYYEADDYPPAIRLYRAAAQIGPLDATALACLACAESHEPMVSHRRLTKLWPDSIDHALAEVAAKIWAGYPAHAVRQCTALLARHDLTPRQVRLIRSARLDDALRCHQAAEFAADFLFIWDISRGEPTHPGARLALIRRLVEIGSPRLLDALTAIHDALGDDSELIRIIAAKVEQLTILADLEAARRQQRSQRLLDRNRATGGS